MVCKIISGTDVRGALNYNENKVTEGQAQLILANGFLKAPGKLSFYEKLNRFTELNSRNLRTKTNTIHISLNFDPSEKLAASRLNQIAESYMQRIGFGEQPYLVYQHHDAAHPHVHIVSTLIKPDGKRIPIHYLGKNDSEKARKEIEQEFGLVKAGLSNSKAESLRPIDLQKAVYGKSETKRSISNIVRSVTQSYKFTSLAELNAVLRLYNVIAVRGAERSQMFQKGGLIYSLVDADGERIGIPFKASAIHGKPTLKVLEQQFKVNEAVRDTYKASLKSRVAWATMTSDSRGKFTAQLKAKQIDVVFNTNAQGRTYGVTFIDHNTKSVFKGSDLGKSFSAGAIMDALKPKPLKSKVSQDRPDEFYESRDKGADVLSDFFTAEERLDSGVSSGPNRRRRKKRRKL